MKLFKRSILFIALGAMLAWAGEYRADVEKRCMLELMEKGAIVIDVRTKPEWEDTGVVDGSRLITFYDQNGHYDLAHFKAELSRYMGDKDAPIVILCRTGKRSKAVAQMLADEGYGNVYNVKRGIAGLARSRMPLKKVYF